MSGMHEATAAELADWDRRTVDCPGGHIYQSRAWGEYQAGLGWRPRFLVDGDGPGILALERPWPWIGGGSAYLSRGPVPAGDALEVTVERLARATRWLVGQGIDVVATDAEVPADTRYPGLLQEAGFQPIEEIQPSRHRMRIELAGRPEADVMADVGRSTRQRIQQAERSGIEVAVYGGAVAVAAAAPKAPAAQEALDEFYDLLLATGERRHFRFGPRGELVGWWLAALAAGHLVYLAARSGPGPSLAGLILHRHGGRLSTVHSADRAETRHDHPGALHLLRWRAVQMAVATNCSEMDLGGVDVAGARRIPREGEPMRGLYDHKRGFGARWVEMTGAHEHVARPARYLAGRVAVQLARRVARARRVR